MYDSGLVVEHGDRANHVVTDDQRADQGRLQPDVGRRDARGVELRSGPPVDQRPAMARDPAAQSVTRPRSTRSRAGRRAARWRIGNANPRRRAARTAHTTRTAPASLSFALTIVIISARLMLRPIDCAISYSACVSRLAEAISAKASAPNRSSPSAGSVTARINSRDVFAAGSRRSSAE